MHVHAVVNGVQVKASVDSGATHNFVATKEATRLGLKLEENTNRIKAVNSKAQKIQGVAKNVPMQIGDWKGTCSLLCVPLYDFDLILGVDFLLRAKVALIPHLGGLVVLEEKQPCFVKALRTKDGGKGQPEMLSAIQLKKGQETYVAALIEIKKGQSVEVPNLMVKILKEFKDVMLQNSPRSCHLGDPLTTKLSCYLEQRPRSSPLPDASCRVAGVTEATEGIAGCRALNKVTIKNKYLIPLAAELFDRLSKASYFTKLDLRSGYWQVRIVAGNEGKTTCVTRYGSYELLVMPFGLTNAPATFCNLMNDVLFDYLDAFVVVYLDDIVVYSKTLTEHEKHLRLVFQRLRENRLYVKPEKCEFAQEEITFLGHKISVGLIRKDKGKVQAIMKWSVPTKVTELRSFLGLANYYRSMQCQMAFESMKEAISTEPVLLLPDLDLPFEVQTDASDRALGGVLVQEGHLVAFESRKLNNAEQVLHSREGDDCCGALLATVETLLAGKYLYSGRHNTVADALSRKEDATYGRMKQQVKEGVIRRYWLEGDLLVAKGERWVVAPLPIPERPWENISMDFITGFPKVRDFKSVFVVVDRFSKYVVFIPAPDACPAEEAAKLFFSNVVKHFGLPKDIVSDRDARFTGRFWVELFKLLGSELKFSTANHPQTDG
ncbi:Retrovirus-related Pol polyprotein from transposon 17.6 [Vitis vinifera]|uniref:Retrovirus-related Pol polyprotein from transposon 17.6 n=1 Tax=Vitis vinifera TaxID=29760 RepID=A0A438FDQ4_VITVI|nr:Retrovirus-related Pol polyprotein from transposon 17.6 [Vitis vinifera]